MRFLSIILSLFFISISSFSQEKTNFNTWIIKACFSPDYSNRLLVVNDDYYEWLKISRDKNENGKLGFHSELCISRQLNKKIYLSTGLGYYDIGWKSNSIVYNNSERYLIKKYRLASLLFDVSYNLLNSEEKLNLYISLGFGINKIIESGSFYVFNDSNNVQSIDAVYYEADTRSFLLGTNIGVGLLYKISEKITAFYQPEFQFWIPSIVDSEVSEYLYTINNKLGLKYNF